MSEYDNCKGYCYAHSSYFAEVPERDTKEWDDYVEKWGYTKKKNELHPKSWTPYRLKPKPNGRKPVKKQHPPQTKKADYLKTKEELLTELAYLKAEMAVLKKLDALKEVRQKERNSSQG